MRKAVDWVVPAYGANTRVAHAGAVPYLELWGIVAGGWQLGRAALVAAGHLKQGTGDARFLSAKIETARFYADTMLPRAAALSHTITEGGESALALARRAVLTERRPRSRPLRTDRHRPNQRRPV